MSSRPRVLVVTPDFPPAHGGIQTLVHRLVRYTQRHEVRVVTMPTEGSDAFDRSEAVQIRRSPRVRGSHRGAVGSLNAYAVHEGIQFRPDVVLCAHIVLSPATATVSSVVGARVVQYIHANELRGRRRLAGFAVRRADAIVAVSRYAEGLAVRAGAERTKVHRIHNGVDLPTGCVPSMNRRWSRPIVVTVARLDTPFKGHDVTLRALPLIRARVPDVQWVVIGDGVLRHRLEARVRSLGLQGYVSLLGAVSDAERDSWLARSRVFAMPSRLPATGVGGEGFGIAYLEANAFGLPVVAGSEGGATDAVVDGRTGVLVDPRDHVAVADAVADLLLDPSRASKLGRAGAARAREFSWPNVARRLEDLMLRVATQ
jgi:phosphatidyl-myo-inositol dimannoside synthase